MNRPDCKVDGCVSKQYCNSDYCNKHYQQIRRLGHVIKKLPIKIGKETAIIYLYDRYNNMAGESIIDKSDVKQVSRHSWYLNSHGYVYSNTAGYLHKFITQSKNNEKIDHKDRNKLNNRKTNFRKCTQLENSRNVGLSKNNTTWAKGVFLNKRSGKYYAQICVNRKTKNLGTFDTVLDASKEYDKACKKYHKEFACLNNLESING